MGRSKWPFLFTSHISRTSQLLIFPPSLPPSLPSGIHSKKYIEDDPATKPLKTQENLAAMKVSPPSLPPSLPPSSSVPFVLFL